MSAAIVTRLMTEVEDLRASEGRLLIALRGYEVEPQSPFPLLSGNEVLAILHPRESYRGQPCQRR